MVKLKDLRVVMQAELSADWLSVYDGSIYQRLPKQSTSSEMLGGQMLGVSSQMLSVSSQMLGAAEVGDEASNVCVSSSVQSSSKPLQVLSSTKASSTKASLASTKLSTSKSLPACTHSSTTHRSSSNEKNQGGAGRAKAAAQQPGSGTEQEEREACGDTEKLHEEHKRIQWIGEALETREAAALAANMALAATTAPPPCVAGRRYYSKVLLGNGSEVRIGSSVLLQAPEGELPFLAQVQQLWENEADSFKMMKCRWFYRATELTGVKIPKHDAKLPRAHEKEVMYSDDIDDNYLTTIERPCCVMHLDALPPDIRGDWIQAPDNFIYRFNYKTKKRTLVAMAAPAPSSTAPSSTKGLNTNKNKHKHLGTRNAKPVSDIASDTVSQLAAKRPLEQEEEEAQKRAKTQHASLELGHANKDVLVRATKAPVALTRTSRPSHTKQEERVKVEACKTEGDGVKRDGVKRRGFTLNPPQTLNPQHSTNGSKKINTPLRQRIPYVPQPDQPEMTAAVSEVLNRVVQRVCTAFDN